MRTFRDPKNPEIPWRWDAVAQMRLFRARERASVAKLALLAAREEKRNKELVAMYEKWRREQLIMKNLRELRDLALKVSTYARGYR